MRQAKKLQRKIAKAQQGDSTLESDPKWGVVGERASPMPTSLSPAMAPTIITTKVDTAALQASQGKDVSRSPKSGEVLMH